MNGSPLDGYILHAHNPSVSRSAHAVVSPTLTVVSPGVKALLRRAPVILSTRAPDRQSAAVPPHIADVEQPVNVPAVLPVAERTNVEPSLAVKRRK